MIFESHAHYDDEAFSEDREELLSKMRENGIEFIINVSSDLKSVSSTIALTQKYPFIYGAAGVHPGSTQELEEEAFAWLRQQCGAEKIAAVGEIGLDYYWDEPGRDVQKKWFERQLAMARDVSLPVIIHSRDAAKDTCEILKAADAGSIGGVIHCYSYTKETVREFLDMGFYFGIGGVVTFKNAKKLKEAVETIPIGKILLETDCPYLAPEPYRGKRNTSLNLPYTAREIARLKGMEYEEVVEITNQNARKLFGI